MKPRSLVLASSVIAALLWLAGSLHGQPGTAKAVKYATPQAVFDAAKVAGVKNDNKAFYALLTPESGEAIIGQLIMAGRITKDNNRLNKSAKGVATVKRIDDAFAKHGLTKEAVDMIKTDKPINGHKGAVEVAKKFAKPIKDRGGFMRDMITALNPDGEKSGPFASARLEGVKIDGNAASGTVVMKEGKEERRRPITFRKVNGGWRMELPRPSAKGGRPSSAAPAKGEDCLGVVGRAAFPAWPSL